MGFGPLRVINEDRVEPGQGFGTHAHQNMEIISYVLEGALAHKDSLGNGSIIRYGDVQRMSAGTGVRHSEFNHSSTEPVHFLQVWIMPNASGIAPDYEEKRFDAASKRGQWRLIASGDSRDGSVLIHQDASVYATIVSAGDRLQHAFAPGRLGYIHVATGETTLNGAPLAAGDALKLTGEAGVILTANGKAEVLLFDLPA
jgi:redox-sensitive bicupin YhaK (pirin superfamily)